MGPLVGEVTAGLASLELVGLDWRDMLAAVNAELLLKRWWDLNKKLI
jgi:hypothetical protein